VTENEIQRVLLNEPQFGLKPGPASGYFPRRRFLVNATFAPRLPFEMFDGVGDVAGISVNSRLCECTIKKSAGRADERMALLVFLISRLLANQEDFCA
jgi:hypothetical protein